MSRMRTLAPLLAAAMMLPIGEKVPRGSNPSPTAGPRERKEWTGSHAKENARRRRQIKRRTLTPESQEER